METGEAKTAAKKRAERNKRYAAKFYLADGCALYDALAVAQDYKCGACGRPFTDFTVSMNMDHEHFKITLYPVTDPRLLAMNLRWRARTELKDGRAFEKYAKTQTAAKNDLKATVTPMTIRGLLCPGRYTGCNRLMGRIDKVDWLKKVVHYLENPPMKKVLTFQQQADMIESED